MVPKSEEKVEERGRILNIMLISRKTVAKRRQFHGFCLMVRHPPGPGLLSAKRQPARLREANHATHLHSSYPVRL
jgi:hypothetical protein